MTGFKYTYINIILSGLHVALYVVYAINNN